MCDLAESMWLAERERTFLAVLQGRIARGEGGPDLPIWPTVRADFLKWLESPIERADPNKGLDPAEFELRRALRVA